MMKWSWYTFNPIYPWEGWTPADSRHHCQYCQAELHVPAWSHETPKQFMQVHQAFNAIKQWGLKEAYNKLVGIKKECASKLEEGMLCLEISQSDFEDSVQAESVKTASPGSSQNSQPWKQSHQWQTRSSCSTSASLQGGKTVLEKDPDWTSWLQSMDRLAGSGTYCPWKQDMRVLYGVCPLPLAQGLFTWCLVTAKVLCQ
jgi:hypothetical protein